MRKRHGNGQTDLIIAVLCVAAIVWAQFGGGVPSIIGPGKGPRVIVTVTESGQATPARDAVLAELRTSTNWGQSAYINYETTSHEAAKPFVEKRAGDSLHIGTMTSDGKFGDFLYSGPLPPAASEVVATWKEHGGE